MPKLLPDFKKVGIRAVALGLCHVVAADEEGKLWAWGRGSHGQLGLGPGSRCFTIMATPHTVEIAGAAVEIMTVGAGENHSAAISANGDLYVWGSNLYGQCGSHDAMKPGCSSDPAKAERVTRR